MCKCTCSHLFLSQVYPGSGHPVFGMPRTPVVFQSQRPTGVLAARHHHLLKVSPESTWWVFLLRERNTGAPMSYFMTQANQLDKQPPSPHIIRLIRLCRLFILVFSGILLSWSYMKNKNISWCIVVQKAKKSPFLEGFSVLFALKHVKLWGNLSLDSAAFQILMGLRVMLSCSEVWKHFRLKC